MTERGQRSFGFVGLGAMGMPIAMRLASQLHLLAVADISPERLAAALAAAGPAAVDNPDMMRNAHTVYLCLPSQDATRDVIKEMLQGPAIDRTFIDFGSHPPEFVSRMAHLCDAGSARFCDCPVFGTPSMAMRGELYFLFSGAEQSGQDFNTLASAAGYRMRYAGPTGTASTIKLLQNALGTANLAVAAEVLRLCASTGVDTSLFVDVVRECGGIGLSAVFDRFAEDMAARRDSGEGRLRIAAKDMKAVVEAAATGQVATPLLNETGRQFERALAAGLGERQFTDIIDVEQPAHCASPKDHNDA